MQKSWDKTGERKWKSTVHNDDRAIITKFYLCTFDVSMVEILKEDGYPVAVYHQKLGPDRLEELGDDNRSVESIAEDCRELAHDVDERDFHVEFRASVDMYEGN